MGCSASCPAKITTQQKDPTSNCSSSHGNLSPYNSFSDSSPNPVSRTLSLPTPLIHHPPVKKGDSNHFVSLTSTTYGSLLLMDSSHCGFNASDLVNGPLQKRSIQDSGGSEDPLLPDSVINTWELMEGLEKEEFDFLMVDRPKDLDGVEMDVCEMVKSYEIVEHPKAMPLWKHLSEESLLAKMEFSVVSTYNKALLGRLNACENVQGVENCQKMESLECKNKSSRVYDFEKSQNAESLECKILSPRVFDLEKCQKIESLEGKNLSSRMYDRDESCYLVGTSDQIVLYYTSLRGIRKTYEDCCAVRVILRGFRVCVDERDTSLDLSYREELQEALKGKPICLPQVFIKGKCIGGAEKIKQLNETGELPNLFKGFAVKEPGFICETCGDVRFIPCPNCNGSRKIYDDDEEKLRRCPDCNENGLIRCTVCCPRVLSSIKES